MPMFNYQTNELDIPMEVVEAILDDNWRRAYEIILPLADAGDASAEYFLGWFYEQGIEVPQSYEKAFEWWSKSASKGISESQCGLAQMYETGRGTGQSLTDAFVWYSHAIMNGEEEAEILITGLYGKMSSAELELARQTLQQA